jgi:hypothetical protein
MEQMVEMLIEMEQQMRIWHWQTKSYARHSAFGSTYSELGDLIDSFMEAYMGKYGRIQVDGTIDLSNMADDVISKVDMYVQFLLSMNETLDSSVDSDLLNIRDEMLALLNKLKYLLTLK